MPRKRKDANEGEGSKTAARQYNEKASEFARSGEVDKKAEEAREALDTGENQKLREAEIEGKRHIAEEDPEIRK